MKRADGSVAPKKGAHLALAGILVAAALNSQVAECAPIDNFTKEELALLPNWCLHTQTFEGDETGFFGDRYVARYGPGFNYMHHFCWGAVDAMRAERLSLPAERRQGLRANAIQNFDYVLKHTKPGFELRLEPLRDKAAVQRRLGNFDQALETGLMLVKEFPKAIDGYVAVATALVALKRRDEARGVIDEGIRRIDDPARLQRARDAIVGP